MPLGRRFETPAAAFAVGDFGSVRLGKTTLMNIIGCMDRSEKACIDYGMDSCRKNKQNCLENQYFARAEQKKVLPTFCSGSFRAICR